MLFKSRYIFFMILCTCISANNLIAMSALRTLRPLATKAKLPSATLSRLAHTKPSHIQTAVSSQLSRAFSTISIDDEKEKDPKAEPDEVSSLIHQVRLKTQPFAFNPEDSKDNVEGYKELDLLVALGANINHPDADGKTVLQKTLEAKDWKSSRDLIQKFNADVDFIDEKTGNGALHLAVHSPLDFFKLLWSQRKKPIKRNKKLQSPLHFLPSLEIVRVLVGDRTFHINEVDNDLKTILHYAIEQERDNEYIIALIKVFKADPNIKDRWGNTPQQLIIKKKHDQQAKQRAAERTQEEDWYKRFQARERERERERIQRQNEKDKKMCEDWGKLRYYPTRGGKV